jgi:hypothetical protein
MNSIAACRRIKKMPKLGTRTDRCIDCGWARIGVVLLGLAPVAFAQGPQVPPGMRPEALDDPTLGMTAFEVFVPEKWHFVGRLIQGTSCSPIPFPVFRTTSPDGLTVLERLPRMDWNWSDGPEQGRNNNDCIPLEEYESAQVFLKNVSQMLGVEYVGENPIPEELRANVMENFERAKEANAARYRAAGMRPPEERKDFGQAFIRYTNGSFHMKGLLEGNIYCSGHLGRPSIMVPLRMNYSCTATVRYVRAPEDQFDAAVKMLKPAGATELPQWTQAWNQRLNMQTQQNIANMRQMSQAAMAQSTASYQQFQQSQATNQRLHEQFLSTLQRGTDMSMARSAADMQARTTATSNIVDYALNQQTVRDPNTGALNKVSSGLAYTWADGTGRGFQTSDPNANPNGTFSGTWTRQQVVNGDGTPR